jgi:multidrug transporter EmrE-like cation transporter
VFSLYPSILLAVAISGALFLLRVNLEVLNVSTIVAVAVGVATAFGITLGVCIAFARQVLGVEAMDFIRSIREGGLLERAGRG